MKTKAKRAATLQPRLRIVTGDEIALGPGKIELLELLEDTQSISESAKRMGMSYMKAWLLIQTMNQCFAEPLVTTTRGGQAGGGAILTDTGRTALSLYRQMEQASRKASEPAWLKMQALLRS